MQLFPRLIQMAHLGSLLVVFMMYTTYTSSYDPYRLSYVHEYPDYIGSTEHVCGDATILDVGLTDEGAYLDIRILNSEGR